MMVRPPRGHSAPIDDGEAQRKAAQLMALTDAEAVEVLSTIAARRNPVSAGHISEALGLAVTTVEGHVGNLHRVGLVEPSDSAPVGWIPTGDALITFGRLITASLGDAAGDDEEPRRLLRPSDLPPVLDRVVDRLTYRFSDWFPRETVAHLVSESYTRLSARARVHTHLVSLAERFAIDRLSALAIVEGHQPRGIPEVLFVCTHNAGRSQMAAAFLRAEAGDLVHVRTAGTRPGARIGPEVRAVMGEIGIDMLDEFPKPLTDEVVRAADIVVTMGCGDACPVYPGRRYMNWDLRDPLGEPVEVVREIRDDVHARVRRIVDLVRSWSG